MQTETLVLILAIVLFSAFLLLIYALIRETLQCQNPNRKFYKRYSHNPVKIHSRFSSKLAVEEFIAAVLIFLIFGNKFLGFSSSIITIVFAVFFVERIFRGISRGHFQSSSRYEKRAVSFSGEPQEATYRKLLNLVNGDKATASRLVDAARFGHPGKPEQWYWEKAIYDLIRDRMD